MRIARYLKYEEMSGRTHNLRKTKASELYKSSGSNIKMVQDFLRHASVNTTQRYIECDKNEIIKAAKDSMKLTKALIAE